MLPRIVALIAASAILIGLASTIAASVDEPANPAIAASTIDYSVAVEGLPTLSAEHSATPAELAKHTGLRLLEALGTSDEVTVRRLVAEHPDAVDALREGPPDVAGVAAWWTALDPNARRTLLDAAPGVVGNLEGVPFAVRDVANREHLQRMIDAVRADALGAQGRTTASAAASQMAMLQQVQLALGPPGTTPMRTLVAVDDTWPGRAVVAIGDLDMADYVSYLVPGMFFTVEGQIVDWTEIALDIHRDKTALVQAGAVQGPSGDAGTSVATVAWMGYETPNVFTVGTLDLAEEGATQLGATVAGLRAVRGTDQPHVSLITHSYGSTAASIALARGALDIDAIAIVGSPGVSVDRVDGFGLPAGAVFVAEAVWDPVTDSAFHGVDPGTSDFGAVVMGVGGGMDEVTGDLLTAVTGHLGYFAHGSESMRNFALIGLGRGELVTGGEGRRLLAVGR